MINKIKWILSVLSMVGLWSCQTINHEVGDMLNLDTNLKLEVIADYDINPDERNEPSPVFVRLYELKSTQAFENAGFIEIYERDEEVLGDSLVAKQELKRLLPNTFREESFVLQKKTKYVGLFAEFYQHENSHAMLVFPVTEFNVIRDSVGIKLTGNSINKVVVKRNSKVRKDKNSSTYRIEREQ